MYIDAPLVSALLKEGTAAVVDAAVIREFNEYVCTIPWLAQSPDWRVMSRWESFHLNANNEHEAVEWARNMSIGRHSHVVIAYKWDEPGVQCTIDIVIARLGSFFAGAPGKRLLFGADYYADEWKYSFESLMEFDGGEVLTAVI